MIIVGVEVHRFRLRAGDCARRAAERSGRLVSPGARRVSDPSSAFHRHVSRRRVAAAAARDGRARRLCAPARRARERHRTRRVGGPPARCEPADCRRTGRLHRPSPLSNTRRSTASSRAAPGVAVTAAEDDARARAAISCRRKYSSPCATTSRSESVTRHRRPQRVSCAPAHDTPVVVDTGDALFAAVDIRANEIVGPGYYATMGFAVPAALGVEIASGRRPLVLVGDGAFQMTGAEISQAPALRLPSRRRPLQQRAMGDAAGVFPDAGYNATVRGRSPSWRSCGAARGFNARTPGEFKTALNVAWRPIGSR